MESEVRELLVEELKDAYSAEKQALRCMQKALRKASAEALRDGIQMHIEQTQVQIERVEQAMVKLSVRPSRKICEGRQGGRRRLPFRQPPQSGVTLVAPNLARGAPRGPPNLSREGGLPASAAGPSRSPTGVSRQGQPRQSPAGRAPRLGPAGAPAGPPAPYVLARTAPPARRRWQR